MKLLGCVHLIVSNAAGALNPDFKVGDVMLIQDHVNFIFGPGPLLGPNDERFGPRFPSLYDAYNPDLIANAKKIATDLKMTDFLREGTYVAVAGPNFETRAEMKLLRALGNDAVGMSTVHEVIVARHCDLRVFGFSLITDTLDCDVTHEANVEVGKLRGEILQQFVTRVVAHMAGDSV
ncbi:hypothetical protein B566_EDAN011552 [Ephemera danica]|nr:hypothetical protein B566_EDAN011552 [Ephemera danica]